MAMYGILASGMVILTSNGTGKEIQENPPLEPPEGYIANYQWVETEDQIVQSWYLEPIEGTEQEAALRLTKLQALSLPDDALYKFRALVPEWIVGESYYGPGNPAIQQSRVKFQGHLFKCLTGHVSQADWTPTAAPSLWAEILPGQEGTEALWKDVTDEVSSDDQGGVEE